MPLYGFRCTCGRTEEHYFSVREAKPSVVCEGCGAQAERDLTVEARNHRPANGFPFVTKHITGRPIEIRDQAQLNSLLKAHGLVQRDDASWLEPMEETFDFGRYDHESRSWKGRGVKRKEGSGRGVKGQWV